MSVSPFLPAVFLVACVPAVVAQTATVYTCPRAAHRAFGTTGLWADQDTVIRAQNWYDASHLPQNFWIAETAPRVYHAMSSAQQSWKFTVVLDNTNLSFGTLTKNLDQNLSSGKTTVYDGIVNAPAQGPHTDPFRALWIKLTRPFLFRGPHLLMDVTFRPYSKNTTQRYWFSALAQDQNQPGLHRSSGKSCGGTLRADYSGGQYSLQVSGAAPRQPVTYLLGIDNVAAGNLKIPIPLDALGMIGCELGVVPLLTIPAIADANGGATIRIPFQSGPVATVVFAQAFHPKGASGWATTNTINSILGQAGLFNFVNDAGTGPFGYNFAPISLFK